MYTKKLEWKSFKVYLPEIHAWAKMECGPEYAGMSANSVLELHFVEEPTQEILDKIEQKWDSLAEEAEAAKFDFDAKAERAIQAAKEAILIADFSQMTPAERKIWMNQPLSDDDKSALVAKYPNA